MFVGWFLGGFLGNHYYALSSIAVSGEIEMKTLKIVSIVTMFAVIAIALVAASLTSASDILESNSTLDDSPVTEVPVAEDITNDYCHDDYSTYNCNGEDCLRGHWCDDDTCLTDGYCDDCLPGACHADNGYYGCGGYGRHGGC